jgi:hypothetical protein
MAMLRSAATDPMLDAARAFLENSYKFAALAARNPPQPDRDPSEEPGASPDRDA